MIQENEIRIGNYLEYFGSIVKVNSIRKDNQYYISAEKFNTDYYNVIDSYKAIPLTEEILLKCGLKLITERTKNYMLKGISGEPCFHFNKNNTVSCYKANIKYLHQLQNLYFALTNQELNITL